MSSSPPNLELGHAFQICVWVALFNALAMFVPAWGARVVFRKLIPRVRERPKPRYFVVDVIVLLAMLAAANAFAPLLRSEYTAGRVMVVLAGANMLVIGTWLIGLRALARCQITSTGHRILFHVVLHPLAILGPASVITAGMFVFGSLEMFDDPSPQKLFEYLTFVILVALPTLVVGLSFCFTARSLFRWSLAKEASGKFVHPNHAAQAPASPNSDDST